MAALTALAIISAAVTVCVCVVAWATVVMNRDRLRSLEMTAMTRQEIVAGIVTIATLASKDTFPRVGSVLDSVAKVASGFEEAAAKKVATS